MARSFVQGIFRPLNPDKYKGDALRIIYRSGWELRMMSFLDRSKDVIQWSSEEVVIPYRSPLDNRIHRYFVDFWVKTKDHVSLIEIKPYGQTIPPITGNKKKKTLLKEVATYAVNEAKWKAAREFCAKRGWQFQIVTEKDLPV